LQLDLFFAVVRWSKYRKDPLSVEDKKLAFQHIRYPLIRKADLVNKVLPTQLADPDLYKAALEYHDTNKYNGPADQTSMREYYFDFDRSIYSGIHVNHTPKGTVLTKINIPARKTRNMAPVYPKEGQPVVFTLCFKSCSNKKQDKALFMVKILIKFH